MTEFMISAVDILGENCCIPFFLSDMGRKVFIFPKWSSNTYVSLIMQLEKPLQNFTPCLCAYPDLSPCLKPVLLQLQAKKNEMTFSFFYCTASSLLWACFLQLHQVGATF